MDMRVVQQLPEENDRLVHRSASGEKTRGTVTKIYGNGRVEFTPDDKSKRVMSLPRRFQKYIKDQQYGLLLITE